METEAEKIEDANITTNSTTNRLAISKLNPVSKHTKTTPQDYLVIPHNLDVT